MKKYMYREDPDYNEIDLQEIAGEARTEPPLPPRGIPRQWLPALIRWPIRALLLPFVVLDLATRSLAAKIVRTPYRREGHCYERGNCCFYILVPEPKGLLGRLGYFWATQINGFYPRSRIPVHDDAGNPMRVMGCRYLKKDGRCAHYRLRPALCRQWPLIEYFGPPRILKGCGFKVIKR